MLGLSLRSCSKNSNNAKLLIASFSTSNKSLSGNDSQLSRIKVERLPKGSGGRSSFSGNVVTVFGATGMMGRIICNRLGKEGSQMIVAYRGDEWDARHLKLCGDLGQVQFQEIDIRNPEKIRNALKFSNVVINCIGSNYETSNFSYRDAHVEGPRLIAKMAKECGVQKLIHFSSLNASPNPQTIFKQSEFLKSKYEGELAVRSEFEEAVVVRPSNIYGESDRFLFYYTQDSRRNFDFSIPLWKKGEMTIKMPVHQSDVADGVMKIVNNKDIRGETYDFVGPDTYLLSEIIDYIYDVIQRPMKRSHLSPARLAIAYASERFLKRPTYNLDVMEREFISDSLSTDGRVLTLRDLIGDKFRRFDHMAAWHLKVFNKYSYYNEKLGEFPEPKPPKQLSDDFEFQLRRKLRQAQ